MHPPLRTLTLLLALSALPLHAQQPDRKTRIDALVRPLLEQKLLVGLSIGLVDAKGQELHGYGRLGGAQAGVPDGDTVYEIGSISKVFTATLLAEMARRKLVALEDPVRTLLPDGVTLPKSGKREIQLVDLATHTSGLPRMPDNFKPRDVNNPYADYTTEQMFQFLARCKLAGKPGEKFAYSNLGAGLLGQALARKAGKSYGALLAEWITGPLSMKDTSIALSAAQQKRLAAPHDAGGGKAHNWDIPALAGAGAIRSTARDMLRFLSVNLRLQQSPLDEALQAARKPRHFISKTRAIGLGWLVFSDEQAVWHNGQTGGYHAFAGFDPQRRIGVVVLCNTASGLVDQLGFRLLSLLAGKPYQPVKFRKAVALPEATLREYVGTYRLAPTFALTVTLAGGQLSIQATGQSRIPVYAAAKDRLFYRVVAAEVVFQRDGAGKVTGLVLHQHGREMPAQKTR